MKLADLKKLAQTHSEFSDNLSDDAHMVVLHISRWIDFMVDARRMYIKKVREIEKEEEFKKRYYKTRATEEELKARNLPQFNFELKKYEYDEYLKNDTMLCNLRAELNLIEANIEYIQNTINNLRTKSFAIKNKMDYEMFKAGVNV